MRPIPLRPAIRFKLSTISKGPTGAAVERFRYTGLESDRDLLGCVGCCLRADPHAELDQFDTVDIQFLQLTCFVTDVQHILVAAVGFGGGGFDRNVFALAVCDQLGAARKRVAEFLDSPGGNDLDVGVECFGGKLEATLVVSLAGRPVRVRGRTHFAGHLQTDFADQRASDRCPEQIYLFILCLPCQDGKGEVAAEFFAGVDDAGRRGAAVACLLHDRLAVFAGLAEINIDRMDLVALVLEPAENNRRIEATGVSQYTTFHYDDTREMFGRRSSALMI